jgi:aspartyl-tRNA(Asn)/glutamyl-tRNA(Gln) amidotransferase subunit C
MSESSTGATDKPVIEEAEVERIAELCHLELDDDELERMTHDLAEILSYVRQLKQVDVEGVAPTAQVLLEAAAARPDEPQSSLERERFLASAPGHNEDGFVVPAFVDEG